MLFFTAVYDLLEKSDPCQTVGDQDNDQGQPELENCAKHQIHGYLFRWVKEEYDALVSQRVRYICLTPDEDVG